MTSCVNFDMLLRVPLINDDGVNSWVCVKSGSMLHANRSQGPEQQPDAQFYDYHHFPFFVLCAQIDDNQEICHLSELRRAAFTFLVHDTFASRPDAWPTQMIAEEDSMKAGAMYHQLYVLLQSLLLLTSSVSDSW